MNRGVLSEVGIHQKDMPRARLEGYRLVIEPLANLVEDRAAHCWGIVGKLTHRELIRLYNHASSILGGSYHPHPVVVDGSEGSAPVPALCYISHDMVPAPAVPEYVDRVLKPAVAAGFPAEYLEHIRSFGHRAGFPR